ncbi:MAG: hypothetical protein ACUVT0_10685 [Thermochromatium sp.]
MNYLASSNQTPTLEDPRVHHARHAPCFLKAWSNHAPELKRDRDHRLGDAEEAADLLQDTLLQ